MTTAKRTMLEFGTLSMATKICNEVELLKLIKHHCRMKGHTLRSLSLAIGANPNYLSLAVKHKPDVPMLLAISSHLGVNFLYFYTGCLSKQIQTTIAEAELQKQIEDNKVHIARQDNLIEVLKDVARGR